MPTKTYTLDGGDDTVPLTSFMDEFKIDPFAIDIHKLRISIDLDWSGVWYAGEQPEICVVIAYDEPIAADTPPLRRRGDAYPQWICSPCGRRHGRSQPELATWHDGRCDICGAAAAVTEPRDFGHLKPGWELTVGQE
jgi:hypothetical protein